MRSIKVISKALSCLIISLSFNVNAGLIHGGSGIIDDANLVTLQGWLGQGDIDLTNIFTKTSNENSYDWHAAVDGKGPTFTLIEATSNGQNYIFGGYNDFSWHSNGSYHVVAAALNDSFLFSLTNNVKMDFHRTHSTFNQNNYGATFGGGHDLYVNTSLTSGYTNLGHTYGDSSRYNTSDYRALLAGSYSGWQIQQYETFSVSAAVPNISVPEPQSIAMFVLALLGLSLRKRNV